MKILRVRRGFTTNSSGDAEFLVPRPQDPSSQGASGPTAVSGSSGMVANTGATSSSHSAGSGTEATSPSNAGTLGIIGAGVMMLFVVERTIRKLLRRKDKEPHDIPPADQGQ